MEIPKEQFTHLVKKAITINDSITQAIADGFKMDVDTLKKWSEGEDLPLESERMVVLQKITTIMLETLGNLAETIK